MLRRIYMDHSATTPVDTRVIEAMMPFLTEKFGNASSIHHFGQEARAEVDRARHKVAAMLNSRPNEIVFTSGGTEANNLAIRGLVEANRKYGNHIITSAIEHPSVKNVCEDLEKSGCTITYLPVYDDGLVRTEDLRSAVRDETILVTVMTANNEIGTLQPIQEIGRVIRERREKGRKLFFHTDAVQAAGKVTLDVEELGCDLLSMSAHKLYAPKGIGALYVRRGVRLHPQNIGGHQERDRRGGTEPVYLIAGFGRAVELAGEEMDAAERLSDLRNQLEQVILEQISGVSINGDPAKRLPNLTNISFSGIEGEGLLINLDMQGIAVSTGSACSSGTLEPSPVIRALGKGDDAARGAIRFSLGRGNTNEDVERVLNVLPDAVENLRRLTPAGRGSSMK
jgi:cysteine desulfurase